LQKEVTNSRRKNDQGTKISSAGCSELRRKWSSKEWLERESGTKRRKVKGGERSSKSSIN